MIIDINIFGERKAQLHMEQVKRRSKDISLAMPAVAEVLRYAADQTFESQGRRGGGSWARISPRWVRQKVAMGLDPRIEHATLRLRESLSRADHPEQRVTFAKDGISFGSKVPYAGRQNASRQLVKLTASDKKAIRKIILDYVVQ